MVDDETGGSENGGEGVGDVVVALFGEAGFLAGGLVDAVGVVGVTAVAAGGGADDVAESELNYFFKDMSRNFRTKEGVRDGGVDGLGSKTRAAQQARFRFH